MTPEEKFFIRVLSDHLSGQSSSLVEGIHWETIYRLSRIHQVEGIVYYQCKAFMPDSILDSFRQDSSTTLYLNINRRFTVQEFKSAFDAAGIPFVMIKGFSVAQYYPVPDLRTMGDCDIIIRTSDVSAADSLLISAGYTKINEYLHHEWTYKKGNTLLELHDALVREDEYTTSVQEQFFNNFSAYVHEGQLDWSFHFIFLLMHLRKHFIKNGVGIRQFMDLAVIIRSNTDLQWDWIEASLKKLNLLQFANACYDLINFWFGIEKKDRRDVLDAEFREKITLKILSNGVFGFSDSKNITNIQKNEIIMVNAPRWFSKTKALLHSVFLPYQNMRKIRDYRYVDNKRFLMPIAWIHRLGVIIFKKNKSSTLSTLRSFRINNSELNEREELLTKMGLM